MKPLVILICVLLSMPLWTGPASADVFISKISVNKDTIPYNDCVYITATVTNTETSYLNVEVMFYLDNNYYMTKSAEVPPDGNGNATVKWCPTDDDSGSHMFKAKAFNSSASIEVYAQGPDIIIKEFSVDKTEVELNHFLKFTMTVENREPSLTYSFKGYIYMDDTLIYQAPLSVDPGASITTLYNFKVDDHFSIGAHSFTFKVFDVTSKVSVTFFGTIVLSIRYIDCEEWAEAGDTILVVIHVDNRGNGDAHNVSVQFELDDKVIDVFDIGRVPARGDSRYIFQWRISEDTKQGDHTICVSIEGCGTAECEAYGDIYISNPLGNIAVHYYIIGFVIAGVVMGAILAFFVMRGAKGKAKTPKGKGASEEDDIVILED
jgi:hypothetical protein